MKHLLILLLLSCNLYSQSINGVGNQNVSANFLQGRNFSATSPTDLQVICWDNSATSWKPCTPTSGGIISVNGLSGGTQTFAVGSTGTDFNIVSSGTVHTFHFPSASSTNRGLLTAANYLTFAAKEPPISTGPTSFFWNGTKAFVQIDYSNLSGTPTLRYQSIGVDGNTQPLRGRINMIAGASITLTPSDNNGTNSTDVTINTTGGAGTVTHIPGALTANRVVKGNGNDDVKTTGCSIDSNDNQICPGGFGAGTGSGSGGVVDFTQGSLPIFSIPNTFSLFAPTTVPASYQWRIPSADAAGFLQSDGAGTPGILSIVPSTGTGAVVRSGSPTGTGTWVFNNITVNGTCTGCSGGGGGSVGSQRGAFSSRPVCNSAIAGQTYYSTDSVGVSSQCDSTSWVDFVNNIPVTLPPIAASFTTVNGGTLSQSGGALYFTKSTNNFGVSLIPIPSPTASWDIRLAARLFLPTPNNECGLWVTQGTTAGTAAAFGSIVTLSAGGLLFNRGYAPINGGLGDFGNLNLSAVIGGSPIWFRMTKAGTTITTYIGDGTDWAATGTFSASSLTHYGFGCDPRSTSTASMKVYSLSVQ